MSFHAKLRVTRLPKEGPLRRGYKRVYDQCKTCERIYYRDFVPYSLSNPCMELPCGHASGFGSDYLAGVRQVGSRTYSEGEEIS